MIVSKKRRKAFGLYAGGIARASVLLYMMAAPNANAVPVVASIGETAAIKLSQIGCEVAVKAKTEAEVSSLEQGLYLNLEHLLEDDTADLGKSSIKASKQVSASLPSQVNEKEEDKKTHSNQLCQTSTDSNLGSNAEASVVNKVKSASQKLTNMITFDVELKDASNPVAEAHAVFLLVFSFATIVMCCASTTFIVRAARDSNIAMNALNIRRKYQRNMQLYMIVKEKKMIDRQL